MLPICGGDIGVMTSVLDRVIELAREAQDDVPERFHARTKSILITKPMLTCSPKPDPQVMRVYGPFWVKEILDESIDAQEAAFGRADRDAVA
jgi:hypothetical protein